MKSPKYSYGGSDWATAEVLLPGPGLARGKNSTTETGRYSKKWVLTLCIAYGPMSTHFRNLKHSNFVFLVIVLGALGVGGCVTTPEFDAVSGVTPATIADVVKCELIWAREDHPQLSGQPGEKSPPWLAVADLTLQVDESATLTPAFTHTDVVSKAVSHVFGWGIKFDTQAQRIYTQSITFKIDKLKDPTHRCDNRELVAGTGFSLNGRLGLSEVVGMAFASSKYVPAEGGGLGGLENKALKLASAKAASGGESKNKYFGQALEFVVTKNLNGVGPTWILTFFRGPGGFFKVERGDTHKLSISFAPYSPGAPDRGENIATYGNSTLLQQNSASRLNQIQQKLD